ncbi:UNVERIFIED_CONTAM: putative UDP-N-acetylglucosamine--peptide N-acetylglucosaminyltransferase SEC [Sesamum radiatum]|uniref:protein O-GlcNAc transferase n=1 Tax=Sesamum radiatum TaxID=300843 RepID=A0AAW2TG01_SESRA
MLSLQSDPRQYNLNLQQLQQQQQQQQQQLVQQQVARVPYNVGTDHHREDSSLALASASNIKQELSREVDEDMLLNLAHQNYKAGNYKQALEHSKAVYERNPRRTDNLLLLGAVYYQLHDFDLCIAKNEEALRIDPQFAECYGNMANAWKEKGNIDVAIRYYLIAIELRPNFADAWSNLASAYMRKGRLTEAAQCCRQALALNPRLVDAHSNLGNLMKAQGLVQEAYNCYLDALRIQPTFAIAWSNLAGLFMEAGDLNRALQYYKKNLDVLDPSCQPKRSDYGLPEDKFIFACFNQLYKMDPEIFTTWCNILKRVPNSALWLLRFPAAGEMRLRAHAAAQGVQPDQIIFTDVAMKQEHIRRSALADLFLDTPLCNAHTTGTDVLWAGLPMVTLPLEKMATRVAGSLCLATGVGEEMIVNSMKEYEEKAVSLALNRPKLQDLTNRLKAARLTCPLFDTARWVRNLERAYFKMWNLYCSGQHPQPFKVAENDLEFPYDR